MDEAVKTGTPRWILIATGMVGLIAALFVAAAKYYEIHKARAEAARAQVDLVSGRAPSTTHPAPADSEASKQGFLRPGSIWKGTSTWAQGNLGESPISLVVMERAGNSFRGVCSWGIKEKEDVAEVEGQVAGDRITFRELKILSGAIKGYPIPCIWTGTISGRRSQGRWTRGTAADGTFDFACQAPE